MIHIAIPEDELQVFASLKDVKVVFDVGARDDVDYLIIKPDIELHAFEPNPLFFSQLESQLSGRENVHLNMYGLGRKREVRNYNVNLQSFEGKGGIMLPIRTLDWYVKKYDISTIDFLKIDVEGLDIEVLMGGKRALKRCRYVQFEHWDNVQDFVDILGKDFDLDYIGGRNYICTRKGEPRPWIPEIPKEGCLTDKTDKNRLK